MILQCEKIVASKGPDEDFLLIQNISIINIFHSKIIFIKYFLFRKKIDDETRCEINKPLNIYLLSVLPFLRIYIYKVKKSKRNERCCCCYIIPYNSLANVVRLLAERFDTKSNVKLGGFRSQLQASYVSSHTEEMWYNETVSPWIIIYR